MDLSTQEKAVNRLKSASGHLQGIVAMLEEDRYCIDVIMQIQAVQAALTKTSQMILDSHLHQCVITAIQGDEPAERERVLEEIMQVFKSSSSK
jgi:DNA-binding FrmR family transcriptional regulator